MILNKNNKNFFTILSENLSNVAVGSAPGVNINIKGVAQFELSNDEIKSNGGGSIYLLSRIDSSTNKNEKFILGFL